MPLPSVSRIVPVVEALDRRLSAVKTSPAVLDLDRLAASADPRPGYADAVGTPAQCSPDGAWLRIGDRPYTFSRKQPAIIRLLFDAWELAPAEYDSKRLQDAFKTHPQWCEVIEVENGLCRLRVEAAD